jgi:catechol 2,3-dioxygenase-like lactoylglutathione lyase family enzyme
MIDRFDHIVLTVRSFEATLSFYQRVLGFEREIRPDAPASLKFGRQKINVHRVGSKLNYLDTSRPCADIQDRPRTGGNREKEVRLKV